ncbi:MAG: tRNA-dihydrouridine synthase family protein [Phocaeicola sp.]
MKIVAAPLQGFTETPWRNAHQAIFGGIDTYYTPFMRIEKNAFRNKDMREVDPELNKVDKLVPQIIASTPDELHRLVEYLQEKGYSEIDLNMGCPFPLITGRQKGSGLLPHPEMVAPLLEAMASYSTLRFSVKMRLGFQEATEWRELLPILNSTPLAHITLHPRLGKQQYKGVVDREGFAQFYEACSHPLIYNGDLQSLEQMQQLATDFPQLAGIMLGRGLLSRPSLAAEFKTGQSLSDKELLTKFQALHEAMLYHYETQLQGETQVMSKLKSFWEYAPPMLNPKKKKVLLKCTRLSTYKEAVHNLFW